jgi:hypothetical protein
VAEESTNGYEQELAEYETQLARYLQDRIKPNLSRSAIPLVARSIAKEIVHREPPEPPEGGDSGQAVDFEAEMHDLQAELGEDWILRFSVHGDDSWLTAEKQDASQRAEAPDAQGLIPIVDAINQGGGRRR